jgi:hypothetical protein
MSPATTSHAFTWQTFSFGGDAGSCELTDVTIINDSLAYATGAVYLKDSLGNYDPNAYNLLKWDGHTWTLSRLDFYTYWGQPSMGSYITTSIIGFSESNIWVASGPQLLRWYGDGIPPGRAILPFYINKFWAQDSNVIYAVGKQGGVALYSAGTWNVVGTGTNLDFFDVYGALDPHTGKDQILAVCDREDPPACRIYSIEGATATEVPSNLSKESSAWLQGIWFLPNSRYDIAGEGFYYNSTLADSNWKSSTVTQYATTAIRANAVNDIFMVGAYGECLHWNGASWKSYISQVGLAAGAYASIAVRGNLVIAVGEGNPAAAIAVGRR